MFQEYLHIFQSFNSFFTLIGVGLKCGPFIHCAIVHGAVSAITQVHYMSGVSAKRELTVLIISYHRIGLLGALRYLAHNIFAIILIDACAK